MKTQMKAIAALLCGTLAASFAGIAASDPIATIEARQEVMKYIGSNMRTLGGMARGDAPFNGEYVRGTGRAVAAIARAFPLLFPAGTESGANTEAAAAIFADRQGFDSANRELRDAAGKMAAAQSPDEFAESFAAFAATCKSCHSAYRK